MKKIAAFLLTLLAVFSLASCSGEEDGGQYAVEGVAVPYSPCFSYACFDIDSDGVKEDCELVSGHTSGVFSFYINASVNGERKYSTFYGCTEYCDICFKEKNGKMYVYGKKIYPEADEPEERYCDISVKDDIVYIDFGSEE